jgi:hydrogenase maturation protein HypF
MIAPSRERRAIEVRGIVQGVGFRPFIHALAREHRLAGLVRNDTEGVQIEVEGAPDELDAFVSSITSDAPPLAVVESVAWQLLDVRDDHDFRILESRGGTRRQTLIAPDATICEACLAELFDPADRRFRYPFINCTNCGPRFSITKSVPYDRALTTMAGFTMCPTCQREYDDPANRRFHAQPNACPECGPRVMLIDMPAIDPKASRTCDNPRLDPISRAAQKVLQGAILAVKGLGGYHLACNPFDPVAVGALRERKVRQDKPFAIMARDLDQARQLCWIGETEGALLTSPARPIVLLERCVQSGVADEVAPRQRTLGLMLAYTPLHHLLLHDAGIPLVMTSGNRSDEPIAYRDEEARAQLGAIADAFLIHGRPIHMRCDDSVTRVVSGKPYPLRRSRGYAPAPLGVSARFGQHTLACGGELKNTFCLAKEGHAFLSHHIGDLKNFETLRSFEEGLTHYSRLFDIQPALVAYDLHPDYLATKHARELEESRLPGIGIQHHHAHIAACLADNELPVTEQVIGVALDGTGYGTDGAIWGGEFFTGSLTAGFLRRAHLAYAPLPGGEAAIRQPWRGAIARLISLYGEEETQGLPMAVVQQAGERNVRLIARLIAHGLNTPQTSSTGRLFDAVGALVGVPGSTRTTYEGQAAIELELLASETRLDTPRYPVRLTAEVSGWIVGVNEVIEAVVAELRAGSAPDEIAARFHRTMAEVVLAACTRIRTDDAINVVALSGGTFQNMLLLQLTSELLDDAGFTVCRHSRVPTNDGGLAFGQAVLANQVFRQMAG